MRRGELATLAAGVVLFLLVCNAVPFGHYVDDVVWALLARSFLHGSVMADWSFAPRVETTASWGFPLLLMPAAPLGALAMKAWSAALFAAGTSLFALAVRSWLPEEARVPFLASLFFTGYYASFSGNVISEAGYVLVFGLAAYLASRERPFALGALTALLILERAIGLAFFLGCAATLRRKDLARYALGAALAAPYFLISKLASGSYTYHASVFVLPRLSTLAANAWYYFKGLTLLSTIFFPAFLPNLAWLKVPAALGVGAVAARGVAAVWSRKQARFLIYYAAAYAAVILCWPYQAPRFAVPVYPLFALFLFAGAAALAGRRAGRACAALAILGALTNAGELGRSLKSSFASPVDAPHEAQLWLKDHTRPDEPVVSMDIARVRWYSGRRGVHFIPSETADEFAGKARALGARTFFLKEPSYVPPTPGVVDPLRAQYDRFKGFLLDRRLFEPVYTNAAEGATVFALKRS